MNATQDATPLSESEFDYAMDFLVRGRGITLDDGVRAIWWESLKNVEGPVLVAAVENMVATDEGYPTAARLRSHCTQIAKNRLAEVVQPSPPSGLSVDEYQRWNREWRRQIMRGSEEAAAAKAAVDSAYTAPERQVEGGSGVISGEVVPGPIF